MLAIVRLPHSADAAEAPKGPRGVGSEPGVASAVPLALAGKAPQKALPAVKLKPAAAEEGEAPAEAAEKPAETEEEGGAQVVSLDAFRKKT